MIYGIGIDLVEIARIEHAITRTGPRFIERIYTELEQQYCRSQTLSMACFAVRFAAKEAFVKALGTGLRQHMRWRDIEIQRDALGKPSVHLYGPLREHCTKKGIHHIYLSLSHSASMAIAQVVLEC
jgi:holo-[acyl-carrier protein] synthase